MCVIAISNERNLSEEEFANCFRSNRDGFGMAWMDKKGSNHFLKGIMDSDLAWIYYQKQSKKVGFPHVCHFRIGTSGGTIPELTHPFIVDEKSETKLVFNGKKKLLFHNGIISKWEVMKKNLEKKILKEKIIGEISDTRIAAIAVSIYGNRIFDTIGGGKYVTLTPSKKANKVWIEGEMETFGEGWIEEKGIQFSNSSFESYSNWRTQNTGADYSYYRGFPKDEDENLFLGDEDIVGATFYSRELALMKLEYKPVLSDAYFLEEENLELGEISREVKKEADKLLADYMVLTRKKRKIENIISKNSDKIKEIQIDDHSLAAEATKDLPFYENAENFEDYRKDEEVLKS